MRRRGLLLASLGGAAATLAGCGFRMRGAPSFAFDSIHLAGTSELASELRRNLQSVPGLRVLDARTPPDQAQVILDILGEQRQKVVVGRTSTGQVREFQLRMSLKFRLRNPRGRELISDTDLLQQRDISFNESAVLAKEAEEVLLYNDMQSDLVQQVLRRLAAVRAV
ncbi:LPS-assembly lipoprotein LptE [Ramlibacter sp. MAHUQ-53]|uniref:LPS-assembly lipoprotein LptE n=1 Tax=unclassified Ramlibacter TaxID=2617605 RepID=UPI00363C1E8F